jgi:hypothetical protein
MDLYEADWRAAVEPTTDSAGNGAELTLALIKALDKQISLN